MATIPIPGVRVHNQVGNKVYCFCPFHKEGLERSPSMVVYLDSAQWKCHSCSPENKSLQGLLEALGLTPQEATTRLRELQQWKVVEPKAAALPPCPEMLLGQHLTYRPAPLLKAGFTREVLDEMEVGFDQERYRAIYPIRNPKGVLMGVVGGALYPKGTHEYLTHYGTEEKYLAYGKRQGFPYQVNPKLTCWNLHRVVRSTVREPVVIVEGFKALMWVRMAGWTNVVALGGAGVTSRNDPEGPSGQVELLAGLAGPYLLFLDNDPTGVQATAIAKKKLRRRTGGVQVVRYPRRVAQPDDLTLEEIRVCLKTNTP